MILADRYPNRCLISSCDNWLVPFGMKLIGMEVPVKKLGRKICKREKISDIIKDLTLLKYPRSLFQKSI